MNYNDALKIATNYHKGQYRKISGAEYITHPIAVADKFKDEKYKIPAVLHDAIEDTDLSLDQLRKLGLDETSSLVVDILTRKENQSYLDYLLLCKSHKVAKEIKIEDLNHNLSDNPVSNCAKDKYLMALYILKSI